MSVCRIELICLDFNKKDVGISIYLILSFCTQCTAAVKTFDVENEFHFLVICKQYVKLRSALYSHLSCPEFDQLNNQNKFCYMLTHTPVARLVGQFIIDAFDDRPVKT